MSMIVRKTTSRAWPATVAMLVCDEATGEVTETKQTFIAHWKAFTEDDIAAARALARTQHPAPAAFAAVEEADDWAKLPVALLLKRNAAVFRQLLCGWGSELRDESNTPIPFGAEALTALVTGPDGLAVSRGLSDALGQLRFGTAPEKNSAPSPSLGPDAGEGVAKTNLPTI